MVSNNLYLQFIDGRWWRVHHAWYANGFVVPADFYTDFASIPRFFWRVLPPIGPWGPAAVLHDYLYKTACTSRKTADLAFYIRMKADNVPAWQRWIMYAAVRVFGGRYYAA